MNKIGIFGGSFNPPHFGHLILAERCRELLQLDKIIFIPAYISPHKTNKNVVNPTDRLKMLKLAIKRNPYFDYSDIEIKRKGKSFTYDTLVSLLNKYTNSKLYLLIGMDNYNDFCNWKNYKEILQLCKVVVINRRTTKNKRIENSNIDYSRFIFVDTLILDISSTEIRNRIKKKLSIRYYTTENVKNFIVKNNLYI